jgi:hypothetical protein
MATKSVGIQTRKGEGSQGKGRINIKTVTNGRNYRKRKRKIN